MASANLILGDCIEKMKELPANSIDAIITDPPYGLEFMGKEWDGFGDNENFQRWCKLWATEAIRILKTGGFMFAMGGTRTHHRLTCGIEDAGFMIRDELCWIYIQGFPKAQSLDALIDKKSVIVDDERNGLAAYLSMKRKEKGLSKSEIDETLGTNTAYSWWEGRKDGIQIPTEELYIKLKVILGLDDRYDKLVSDEEKRRRFEEKRRRFEEKREKIGEDGRGELKDEMFFSQNDNNAFERGRTIGYGKWDLTQTKSPLAKEWQGWKTPALKPAFTEEDVEKVAGFIKAKYGATIHFQIGIDEIAKSIKAKEQDQTYTPDFNKMNEEQVNTFAKQHARSLLGSLGMKSEEEIRKDEVRAEREFQRGREKEVIADWLESEEAFNVWDEYGWGYPITKEGVMTRFKYIARRLRQKR